MRLLHELGSEATPSAAQHRRLIREACAREGGVEVDTQGDAFFFAFPTRPVRWRQPRSATEALAPGRSGYGWACTQARRSSERRATSVRTSTVRPALPLRVTADRLSSRHPQPPSWDRRSRPRRAPLQRPRRSGARLSARRDRVPSASTLYQTNLPVPPTPFLGRRPRELAEVVELLAREEVGLLTLTGVGGSGKTRLLSRRRRRSQTVTTTVCSGAARGASRPGSSSIMRGRRSA